MIGFGDEDDAGVFCSKGLDGGERGSLAPAPSGSQYSQPQSSGARGSNKRKATDDDRNQWSKNQHAKHHKNDYKAPVAGNQWYPDVKEFHNAYAYLPHLWSNVRDSLMNSTTSPPGI